MLACQRRQQRGFAVRVEHTLNLSDTLVRTNPMPQASSTSPSNDSSDMDCMEAWDACPRASELTLAVDDALDILVSVAAVSRGGAASHFLKR